MDAKVLAEAKFGEPGREDWLAMARKATGHEDPLAALRSSTDDGLTIEAIAERAGDAAPVTRLDVAAPWKFVQRIDDPDVARANRQALEDAEGGATGFAVVFEGAPNAFGYGLPATSEAFQAALEGVSLNRCHLRIDVHPQSRQSVDWMVDLLRHRRLDPSRLTLAFGIDPAATFAGTGRLRMSIEALHASMPQSLAHFFALGVPGVLLEADGRVLHNAGATEAQELGFMLAAALSHLKMFEEARQPLVYATPHIGFALSVDQDQFLSMAKVRALRKIWRRAQEACRIQPAPAAVHAETSYRMITAKDFETNILRNTIALFGAAVGGADSVSILPHTIAHGLPDAFARRVARNTHVILAEEAHVDFVADPAAGAGGIEALTDALALAAWDEFKTIEAEGGVLQSLAAGHIQKRVNEARDRRAAQYSAKDRVLVGATLYPAASERKVSVLDAAVREMPVDGTVFCEKLSAGRIDVQIGADA